MIWLLIAYLYLYLHRPFEIWPILGTIQIERVFVIAVVVAALVSGQLRTNFNKIHFAIGFLVIALLLSWILGPTFGAESATFEIVNWLKLIVIYLLFISLCNDRRSFELLVVGLVACTGVYLLHSVYEFHLGKHTFTMGIARLNGINSTFGHPNSISTITLITMPFAIFLVRHGSSKLLRTGALSYIPLAVYAVIQSGSRTGIVGLLGILLIVFVRSKYKFKIAFCVIAAVALIWPAIPEAKQKRFLSLYDESYAADQLGANESVQGRYDSLWNGIELFQRYPLTGAGPDSHRLVLGSSIVSHNLYGQLLGEVGLLGTIAFSGLVLASMAGAWTLWRCRTRYDQLSGADTQFFSDLGYAFLSAYVMMLLFGAAGGTLYRYYWVWIPALITVASEVFQQSFDSSEAPKTQVPNRD